MSIRNLFLSKHDFVKKALVLSVFLIEFTMSSICQIADTTNYAARKAYYYNLALHNPDISSCSVLAFLGEEIDSARLDAMLSSLPSNKLADFRIRELVRVLFLSNGEYDDQILNVLDDIPFWLTPNDILRCYWSENHMIMWTSSAYLLNQKYGWDVDANMEARLIKYLNMKIQYGYYEYFSPTYSGLTLDALLNLVDFAVDPTVQSLAVQATDRLLSDMFLLVNNKGRLLPASGRGYYNWYEPGDGNSIFIWLMTGLGEAPTRTRGCDNIASSNYDISVPVNAWSETENLDFSYGHSPNSHSTIYADMPRNDRTIFQWSYGGWFHPGGATETAWMMDEYNLWDHPDFNIGMDLSFFANWSGGVEAAATFGASITRSSVLSGGTIGIFKNKGVTLSSTENYWGGYGGYQQMIWCANVDSVAVWTQSGEVKPNWYDRSRNIQNTQLPKIFQTNNVALIMYRPNADLGIFRNNFDVALFWPESDFHETRTGPNWLLGRVNDSYVAVRRDCENGMINGWPACSDDDRQVWAVMVGNAEMYGSFANFETLVNNADFEKKSVRNLLHCGWDYYGRISFDGTTIAHEWTGSCLKSNGKGSVKDKLIEEISADEDDCFKLYPNPVTDYIMVDVGFDLPRPLNVKIRNVNGKEIYSVKLNDPKSSLKEINVRNWFSGTYFISLEGDGVYKTKQVVISQ